MALSKEEERLKKMKKMSRVLGINIHQVRLREIKKEKRTRIDMLRRYQCTAAVVRCSFAFTLSTTEASALGSVHGGILVAQRSDAYCFWFLYPHRSCLSVCSDLSLACWLRAPRTRLCRERPVPVA